MISEDKAALQNIGKVVSVGLFVMVALICISIVLGYSS